MQMNELIHLIAVLFVLMLATAMLLVAEFWQPKKSDA
jgi:hypothetical protein